MPPDALATAADGFPPAPPRIAAPPFGAEVRPAFVGEGREFRRLAIRGALLEFVTFGFYRFWLATKLRRHLWSNTLLEGEPFEYTGTAKELFIGFLFALAILLPIYFLYFLVGVEAEGKKAFASTPLVLFFYAFGHFAVYRARRYRLTRTTWRGVRFWMDGSGFGYAWRACLWGLLVFVTFGLALPWREVALERYKMRHTYYGDLPGDFVGTGWQFFKRGWWLWLLAWVPLLVAIAAGIGITAWIARTNHSRTPSKDQIAAIIGIGTLLCLMIVPLFPFHYAAFKATEWRWWASGLRFGKLTVTSCLRRSALFGNYWATIGWPFLIFTILSIVITGIIVGLEISTGGKNFNAVLAQKIMHGSPLAIALIAGYFICYFAAIFAMGIVMRVYLMRGVWQKIVASMSVADLAVADAVNARGEAANALGEGFADSLDIAGF